MRDWWTLGGLCAAGFALGAIQGRADRAGRLGLGERVASAIVSPVAAPTRFVARGAEDFVQGTFRAAQLTQDAKRVREADAQLAQAQAEIAELREETTRLRAMFDLPPVAGRTRIAADVVGFQPFEHRATISAGSAKGVRPGLPVVSAQGLVGVVRSCSSSRSSILLLASPQTRIGGVIERDPPSVGLLSGASPSSLILELADPSAPVEVGDVVTTSGFSEYIPRGIPIGKVVQVETDLEFGSKRAEVFPAVHASALREVWVLR